jgi:hypothetical protein
MKWITREKVKVDRVACPWLIKRFILYDALYAECQRRWQKRGNEEWSPADTPGQTRATCNSPNGTTV